MKILITGGAGFIGRKLAAKLLEKGELAGREITRITAFDMSAAEGMPADPRLEAVTGEITRKGALFELVARQRFEAIFHLAAVVSGGAEAEFDLGYDVNLAGTQHLLEAARHLCDRPRLVFASSLAVYGGTLPDPVTDLTHLNPQSSYGVQKAAGELLVGDYARKGMIDGRSLRLPTIVVRPGRPNRAASSFASSIIREPLNGETVVCPVADTTAMFILSPRKVVDAFIHAFELEEPHWEGARALTLNGITASVREKLDALATIAGEAVAARVTFEADPVIQRIVRTWPPRFDPARARNLGFEADPDIGSIIEQHIEDERGGGWVR